MTKRPPSRRRTTVMRPCCARLPPPSVLHVRLATMISFEATCTTTSSCQSMRNPSGTPGSARSQYARYSFQPRYAAPGRKTTMSADWLYERRTPSRSRASTARARVSSTCWTVTAGASWAPTVRRNASPASRTTLLEPDDCGELHPALVESRNGLAERRGVQRPAVGVVVERVERIEGFSPHLDAHRVQAEDLRQGDVEV